ncbi:MAG: nickel pincer cofactor biosynthesis protein LarC [Halobacteriaceae archaeon]
MTVLAFDGRTGASGDMLLGALVAAGADPDALSPVTDALDVTYDVERVTRSGLRATKVTVRHTGDHGHDHAEGHGPHRPYPEVVDVVEGMALPDAVADRALSAFERLGRAEAAVHGTDLSETAFHEVGADDAIADVVGTALLVADLDPDRIVTTPVALGGGETEFSHGSYPVPVPAVTEILDGADFATYGGPEDVELLTPTGAALLAEFAAGVTHLPTFDVEASGYGAGGHDFEDRPNALRALVGTEQGGLTDEDVVVLETNLDDATPEVLGDLQESLAAAGARDVSVAPLTMKKSRPGHLVKALARPADAERVARRLARETGTLGVRATPATHRWVAERSVETATVKIEGHTHEVDVKVATDDSGDVYDVSAEYDDAVTVARETDLPVRDVMRRAEETVRQ